MHSDHHSSSTIGASIGAGASSLGIRRHGSLCGTGGVAIGEAMFALTHASASAAAMYIEGVCVCVFEIE